MACSKEHKARSRCSGKRNRTAFVSLAEFTDDQFMADYELLEGVRIGAEAAKRRRPPQPQRSLPSHLHQLKVQAKHREVELLLQQPGMVRRKRNTTLYDRKKQRLYWRMEWKLWGTDITFYDRRADEEVVLLERLRMHINEREAGPFKSNKVPESFAQVEHLMIFFCKEHPGAGTCPYIEVDSSKTVREALQGQTVVEYPTFLVCHREDAGQVLDMKAEIESMIGQASVGSDEEKD